jgi:hypothetical protein
VDLRRNVLKALDCGGELRQLAYLDVSENQINSLSPLAAFPSLETVVACKNNIKAVAGLAGLVRLACLDLRHNFVQTLELLSEELGPNLCTLYLDGNPLSDLCNLLYLRPFANLESLSFKDSPLARRLDQHRYRCSNPASTWASPCNTSPASASRPSTSRPSSAAPPPCKTSPTRASTRPSNLMTSPSSSSQTSAPARSP